MLYGLVLYVWLIGLSIDVAIGDQLLASSQLIDRSHDMLTGFVWYNCSLSLAISQVIFTVFEVYLLCRCLIYVELPIRKATLEKQLVGYVKPMYCILFCSFVIVIFFD